MGDIPGATSASSLMLDEACCPEPLADDCATRAAASLALSPHASPTANEGDGAGGELLPLRCSTPECNEAAAASMPASPVPPIPQPSSPSAEELAARIAS